MRRSLRRVCFGSALVCCWAVATIFCVGIVVDGAREANPFQMATGALLALVVLFVFVAVFTEI